MFDRQFCGGSASCESDCDGFGCEWTVDEEVFVEYVEGKKEYERVVKLWVSDVASGVERSESWLDLVEWVGCLQIHLQRFLQGPQTLQIRRPDLWSPQRPRPHRGTRRRLLRCRFIRSICVPTHRKGRISSMRLYSQSPSHQPAQDIRVWQREHLRPRPCVTPVMLHFQIS